MKAKLIYVVFFLVLFLSFLSNPFKMEVEEYNRFDRASEGYVLGRILTTEIDGFFSYGGLPCNYVFYKYHPDSSGNEVVTELWEASGGNVDTLWHFPTKWIQAQMYDDYINNRKIYDGYHDVYMSQPSMMGNVYGLMNLILPISNNSKLLFFRFINIFLTTLCFILIVSWVRRNFSLTTAVITFIGLLLSSWLMRFSHNLWWVLWSYYIPFITTLLMFEKRQKGKGNMSILKILVGLFIAVFVKFLLTGAEFITSTLVMAICPIIYYSILEYPKLQDRLILFLKSSLVAISGILLGFSFLMFQIKLYKGTWEAGFSHIIFSFTKRTVTGALEQNLSVWEILRDYLFDGSIFMWQFLPGLKINFFIVSLFILITSLILYFIRNKANKAQAHLNKALAITTCISILGPLSWIIIFSQHAYIHTAFDYIVWYMPFVIYGFIAIGQVISSLISLRR